MDKLKKMLGGIKMLTEKELIKVTGGEASSLGIGAIIGGIATFIIGVIDGFLRPLSCHE